MKKRVPIVKQHEAKDCGAAALGVPEKNTLKQIDSEGFITKTVDRSMLYNPSAVSIWVEVDGQLIECKGGQSTKIF